MADAAQLIALCVAGVNALAAGVGGWIYVRALDGPWFWPLLRVAQALAIGQALFAGVAAALGRRPDSGLYWLYAVLPIALSVIAEQLRLTAAQAVLDARDLPDAQAVGKLDEAGQRAVVFAIMHRELGVMALSAGAICFLALRAASTSHGL
jgi:hypothetical protein